METNTEKPVKSAFKADLWTDVNMPECSIDYTPGRFSDLVFGHIRELCRVRKKLIRSNRSGKNHSRCLLIMEHLECHMDALPACTDKGAATFLLSYSANILQLVPVNTSYDHYLQRHAKLYATALHI